MTRFVTDQDLMEHAVELSRLLPPEQDDWAPQRALAEDALLRDLARRWHDPTARRRGLDPEQTPMDPARLPMTTVKPLAVLKSLEVIYGFLARPDAPAAEGLERSAMRHRALYHQELESLLAAGLPYDWNDSGSVEAAEQTPTPGRRLSRA